jgi:hypothetical protein
MQNKITTLDGWDKLGALKSIDFESGQFDANGKTYYLESKLTVARYCEFMILQRELQMGMSIEEIYTGMIDQRKLLNQMRFVDASVHCDKFVTHCIKLKEKEPTVMKICTLFINTEDEDRAVWNNDLVVRKLADWKKEGINVSDFFEVALTLVPTFIEHYNRFTRSIIEQMGVAETIVEAAMKIV